MKVRKNDIKFHEALKQASIYTYERDSAALPAGYKVIEHSPANNKGFSAVVLSNGQDIILAIRGTDFELSKDAIRDAANDIAMARKRIPAQLTLALDFYDKMVEKYGDNITVTGHSLGGSLAQFLSVMRNAAAVTFNAYGIKDMFTDNTKINQDNTINYVNEWDPIAMANGKNLVGDTYAVKGKSGSFAHFINDFESLSNREFRTKEDLEEHKNLFNRIENKITYTKNKIKNSIHNMSKCVGSYSVSGYTRSDGKEVSSYTRTCGAKHDN